MSDSWNPSEVQRLARGGSLAILGLAVNGLLSFLFLKIVGAHFPTRGAGAIFIALSMFAIIAFIAPVGADIGLLRFMPQFRISHPGSEGVLCRASLVLAFLCATALAILAWRFAPDLATVAVRHGNRHLMERQLVDLVPFVPFSALMVTSLAALRAWTIRPPVLIQNIIVPVARILILLVAVATHDVTPLLVALSWGAPLVIAAAASVALLARRVRTDRMKAALSNSGDQAPLPKIFAPFWIFSAARSVQAAFVVLVVYLDVILVGGLQSSAAAGIYTISSRYTYLGTTPAQGVAYAIGPQLSSLLHRGERASASTIYREGTTWIVMMCWPVLLLLANFAPFFMGFFGTRYQMGDTALVILALAMLIQTLTGNNTVALNMAGKSGTNLVIGGLALATNIGMNLWLIPRLGINGAAIAWVVTIVLTQSLTSLALHDAVGLSPFGAGHTVAMVSSAVCFGLLGAIVRISFGASFFSLLIALAGGGCIYVLILLAKREVLQLEQLRALRPSR
jgi:O-antigen/teichoic acid export membrane protein